MQKVYLLLRNNKQSGPHSLEELVQSGLRPYDLIWIEGKSSGWSYPAEIEALRPYVPAPPATPRKAEPAAGASPTGASSFAPKAQPAAAAQSGGLPHTPSKKIHVILPGRAGQQPAPAPAREVTPEEVLERKAEELRQRAEAYLAGREKPETAPASAAPTPALAKDKEELEVKYARSMEEVEAQYTNWVFSQKSRKSRKFPVQEIGALLMVVVLLSGGYIIVRSLLDKKEDTEIQTVEAIPYTEAAPATVQAAPSPGAEAQEAAPEPSLYDETTSTVSAAGQPATTEETPAVPTPGLKVPAAGTGSEKTPAAPVPLKKAPPAATAATKGSTALPAASTASKEEKAARTPVPTPKAPAPAPAGAAGTGQDIAGAGNQKKTIGQKIDNFFGRLKNEKKAEEATAGSSNGAAEPASSGTPATGRETAATPAPAPLPLKELVAVSSNQPAADNWMMGVQGLKLTLHNNSGQTVQNAAVEVRYYNDQNSIFKKTIVQFSNIPAKRSGTVAVPDERVADHADFRVVSVSGREN